MVLIAGAAGGDGRAGALSALLHAVAVITLRVNQIGVGPRASRSSPARAGLSSYLANTWELAKAPVPARPLDVFGLGDLPIVGPILFHQNVLTYLSWVLVVAASWYLFRTRPGLHLRAVGESPRHRRRHGHQRRPLPLPAHLLGGALAGIGGAFFSLAIIPTWADGVTGGQGWIAIALVIFGFWRPDLTLVGAYLFGALRQPRASPSRPAASTCRPSSSTRSRT